MAIFKSLKELVGKIKEKAKVEKEEYEIPKREWTPLKEYTEFKARTKKVPKTRQERLLERKKLRTIRSITKAKAERKMLAKEMAMERRFRQREMSLQPQQLAQQQRAAYETPAEVPQVQPEQIVEEEYVEERPGMSFSGFRRLGHFGSGFAEAFRKWQVGQRRKQGSMGPQDYNILTPRDANILTPTGVPQNRQQIKRKPQLNKPTGNILAQGQINLLTPVGSKLKIPERIKIW